VHDFHAGRDSAGLDGLAADCELCTAAGAALAPNPVAPPASFAGGLAEPNPDSGVPRAMIPLMEELGVGSGVGSDYSAANGFDLAAAPAQPVPQKFPFEPGRFISGRVFTWSDAGGSGPRAELGGEFFESGCGCAGDAAATEQIADLKPLGQVEREFYRRGERRRPLDCGPARGARTRALRTAPGSATSGKSGSAADADAAGVRAFTTADRNFRKDCGRIGRERI